jgi:hypothetical protein
MDAVVVQEKFDKIQELYKGEPTTIAWKVGQQVSELYNLYKLSPFPIGKKITFSSFYKEIKDQGKIPYSESTLRTYYQICKTIPFGVIQDLKSFTVGHLEELITLNEDQRNLIIEAFSEVEKSEYIRKQKVDLKKYYRVDQMYELINVIQKNPEKYNNPQKIQDYIINKFVNPGIRENLKEKGQGHGNIRGALIQQTNHFQLYSLYEPSEEQELVGLFLTLFPQLALPKFVFKLDNHYLYFSKIIQLTVKKFPDAEIECCVCINDKGQPNQKTYNIFVEFEKESKNFLKHRHYKELNKACSLIICWDNNWKDEDPPWVQILSVKELLKTGEIKLVM